MIMEGLKCVLFRRMNIWCFCWKLMAAGSHLWLRRRITSMTTVYQSNSTSTYQIPSNESKVTSKLHVDIYIGKEQLLVIL